MTKLQITKSYMLKGPARFYHAMLEKRNGATIKHMRLTGKARFALVIEKGS